MKGGYRFLIVFPMLLRELDVELDLKVTARAPHWSLEIGCDAVAKLLLVSMADEQRNFLVALGLPNR